MPGERSSPLTVILPVYNAAPYLLQCIDSLLAQTYRNFKLLIVDDGSTDDSPKIIEEYAQRDARIRPTLNRQNQGLIRVLNTAIAKCESPFIARMDADDWWNRSTGIANGVSGRPHRGRHCRFLD